MVDIIEFGKQPPPPVEIQKTPALPGAATGQGAPQPPPPPPPGGNFTNDPTLQQGASFGTRALVGAAPNKESQIQTLQNLGATDIQEAGTDTFGNPNFIFTDSDGNRVLYNPAGQFDAGDIAEASRMGVTMFVSSLAALATAAATKSPTATAAAAGAAETGAGFVFDKLAGLAGMADTRTTGQEILERGVEGGLAAAGEGVGSAIGRGVRGAVGGALRGGGEGVRRGQRAVSALGRVGAGPENATSRGVREILFEARPGLSVGSSSGSRFVQGAESILSAFPGANGRFAKVARATNNRVAEFTDELTERLARRPVSGVEPATAGRAIQKGLRGFIDERQARAGQLFDEVRRLMPVEETSTADNLIATIGTVEGRVPGLPEVSQALSPKATQISKLIREKVQEAGTLTYGQLDGLRKLIGSKLGSGAVAGPDDISRGDLKLLYRAITDDMKEVAERSGAPGAIEAFNRANQFYTAFVNRVDDFINPILKKNTPEEVFRAAFRGTKEGATGIRQLRKGLNNEQWGEVTGAFLRDMGRRKGGQAVAGEAAEEAGDTFSINTFLTNWNNIRDSAKDAIFNTTGLRGLRKDLDAIAEVGSRIREAGRVFQNASGTAKLGTGVALAGGSALAGTTGNEELALGLGLAAIGSNAAARLLTSPRVVNWLSKGMKMEPAKLGGHIGRLSGIAAGESEEVREAITELLGAIGQVGSRDVPTETRISRSRNRARSGRRGPQMIRPGIVTDR